MSTTAEAAQADTRIKLAELEQMIAAKLIAAGTAPTKAAIAKLGDPIVNKGELMGYTAARYNKGRWVSKAVVARVTALTGGTD